MNRTQKRIERLLAVIRDSRPSLESRGKAFSLKSAAVQLRCSEERLDSMVRTRVIRTVKIGGAVMVLRSELLRAAAR